MNPSHLWNNPWGQPANMAFVEDWRLFIGGGAPAPGGPQGFMQAQFPFVPPPFVPVGPTQRPLNPDAQAFIPRPYFNPYPGGYAPMWR